IIREFLTSIDQIIYCCGSTIFLENDWFWLFINHLLLAKFFSFCGFLGRVRIEGIKTLDG
ncbi:hypothetical protein, partial [Microcystis aeruginosa]|uniref:hypothetical protein n=1 Tax=Microcystis aeruginosa TaxID=1126 RepID=UPI001C121219